MIFFFFIVFKGKEKNNNDKHKWKVGHSKVTYMTVVEDVADGLGDKEDFRPVAADDQQETVRNLMVGADWRFMNKTEKPLRGGGASADVELTFIRSSRSSSCGRMEDMEVTSG